MGAGGGVPGGLEQQWELLGEWNCCSRGVSTPTDAAGEAKLLCGSWNTHGCCWEGHGCFFLLLRWRETKAGRLWGGTWLLPLLQTSVCLFQALRARWPQRRSGCRRGGSSSRCWRPGSMAASRSCGGCACGRR